MRELLQEVSHSRGIVLRVDAPRGILRGVKILGPRSRNGRSYPDATLDRARALYEGAKVNVNHPKGSPTLPRDYQDRIGVIRNVTLRPGAGLFADFYFNPKHLLAEQLLWDAEHAPENVGFSHNVEARTVRRGDRLIVEEILRVQGVDLVADPATTSGLFEGAAAAGTAPANGSAGTNESDDIERSAGADATGNDDAKTDELAAESRRDGAYNLHDNTRQAQEREPDAPPAGDAKGQTLLLTEATPEQLRSERPDLAAALLAESEHEIGRLRAKLAEGAAALAQIERRELIRRLLREFDLPDPDRTDAQSRAILSESFLRELACAADERQVRALVEERARLLSQMRSWRLEEQSPRRPVARDQYQVDLTFHPTLSVESFVRAIT